MLKEQAQRQLEVQCSRQQQCLAHVNEQHVKSKEVQAAQARAAISNALAGQQAPQNLPQQMPQQMPHLMAQQMQTHQVVQAQQVVQQVAQHIGQAMPQLQASAGSTMGGSVTFPSTPVGMNVPGGSLRMSAQPAVFVSVPTSGVPGSVGAAGATA